MKKSSQLGLEDFIAQRVKYLRKEKKLSQDALARKSHVSDKYVSKIETKKPNISLFTLKSIIDGLDVSYEEFFDFDFKNEDSDLKSLMYNLKDLPYNERTKLVDAFQLILDSRIEED